MGDLIRRWTCHACGTPVASNSTGQVRDETGSHHNPGGDRCIRVMQDARDADRGAIAAAGFRVAPDLLGKPTLWCVECGRDSGFHRPDCSKSER